MAHAKGGVGSHSCQRGMHWLWQRMPAARWAVSRIGQGAHRERPFVEFQSAGPCGAQAGRAQQCARRAAGAGGAPHLDVCFQFQASAQRSRLAEGAPPLHAAPFAARCVCVMRQVHTIGCAPPPLLHARPPACPGHSAFAPRRPPFGAHSDCVRFAALSGGGKRAPHGARPRPHVRTRARACACLL